MFYTRTNFLFFSLSNILRSLSMENSQAFMNLAAKFPPRNSNEAFDTFDFVDSHFDGYVDSEEEVDYDTEVKGHYGEDEDYNRLIGNFAASMKEKNISTWNSDLMNLVKDKSGNPVCTEANLKKILASLRQPDTASNWKELREEAYKKGYNGKSRTETSDVVDWESVLNAPFSEVAKCIACRGQHNILSVRIRVCYCKTKTAIYLFLIFCSSFLWHHYIYNYLIPSDECTHL